MVRAVEPRDWRLSQVLGRARMQRLSDVPRPSELLTSVVSDAASEAGERRVRLKWKDCDDLPGKYSQVVAQIPLSEGIFDQLINGRSGYRAQYYLSPEEGILFNRDLLDGLTPIIRSAYSQEPLEVAKRTAFEVVVI
jgi:hypothetical protein